MTDEETTYNIKLDNTDFRIVSLMVCGYDNKEISSHLRIPLSTIQRRIKRILESKIVSIEFVPNWQVLGIKTGLLHTYLRNGRLQQTAEKIFELDGILSCSIHVGNSDIVSEFIYSDDTEDLAKIIGAIKEIEGVEKVLWSEEVFKLPKHPENLMRTFKKFWDKADLRSSSRPSNSYNP